MFELSSKREFMDLCSSPTGLALFEPLQRDGSTLERASNQDDLLLLGGGGICSGGKRGNDENRGDVGVEITDVVSDFKPNCGHANNEPSSQETVIIAESTETDR